MNFFKYTLVRFGLLVFFFYLYELLGAGILVSGGCAIVSAFAVAYIFFPRLHAAASQDTARFFKRTPKVKNKEEEENLPAPASVHVMGGSLRVLASR